MYLIIFNNIATGGVPVRRLPCAASGYVSSNRQPHGAEGIGAVRWGGVGIRAELAVRHGSTAR